MRKCSVEGCENRALSLDPFLRCYGCLPRSERLTVVEDRPRSQYRGNLCKCGCGGHTGAWLFMEGHTPKERRKAKENA